MSGRKCGNCRHYEPSPIWRSGWCRNPRLYGPQESHLVRQEELACAHRIGNYWEPTEDDATDESPGPIGGLIRPLRLFGPGPRLMAATSGPPGGGSGGGGRFDPGGTGGGRGSSSGSGSGRSGSMGGSSGYGGGGRDAFGGAPPGSGSGGGAGGTGGYPPAGGPGRPDPSGRLPGQERVVSYQPEERYWTDYLRIALPVVGLLLMLGLFWFWAANLIGGDDDDDGGLAEITATATATATITAEGPTASETPAPPGPTATTGAPGPTATVGGEPTPPPPTETDPPTQPPVTCTEVAVGCLVVVNDDGVRFRPEPSTETDPIRDFVNGEELEVTGDVVTDGTGQRWIPVTDGENDGFVAFELVDLATGQ